MTHDKKLTATDMLPGNVPRFLCLRPLLPKMYAFERGIKELNLCPKSQSVRDSGWLLGYQYSSLFYPLVGPRLSSFYLFFHTKI